MERPTTSDEWLELAERVERWGDELRALLDGNHGRSAWAAWDRLRQAGAYLRDVAAYTYRDEQENAESRHAG